MRTTLIVLFLLLLAVVGYAWKNNSAGCIKLGSDLGTDLVAIFQPPPPEAPVANPPSPAPAPAQPAPPPPASVVHTPTPLQAWKAPAVLPAQPNWTWTASDGTTYQNVVVTQIFPDTVIIQHSLGVAHLPIANLPPDIQKQLGYDPAAAAAAKAENEREYEHPYYSLAQLPDAQAAARELNWPLAWICTDLAELSVPNPSTNSSADLTQMAVNYLKTRAIVVFVNGNDELGKLTWPVVRERQFFKFDDGAVPGGHHFMGPKIVFTDADITQPLGRVTYTEMFSAREAAIDAVLSAIANHVPAPEPVAPASPPHP